ncbi:MAG TPA: hypothetical protein VIJ61_17420 [Thermoanaerobaculia bacterium]
MKLLGIYVENAGVRVDLTTKANNDVITYVVFVRKWTSAGPLPEATWLPDTLETTGGTLVLAAERGYDFILQAAVRPGGKASIVPDFRISDADGTRYTDIIQLPQSEGPVVERGWKVVIR